VTAPVPPSESIQTGITGNWTRTRPAFFRGLARHLEYAEDKCFGLILQSTVGRGRSWEKVTWKRFCDVAGVTRRRCEQAIASLLGKEDPDQPGVYMDGLIRQRKAVTGGGFEYSIAARAENIQSSIAKCRGCGQTGEVDLDLDFIPVPHSFFLNLPASCDHGMYLVVKTVVERTMRWDKETKQIVIVPCEITIEEFERATGKKRAEILSDLQKVQAECYQFIGSESAGRGKRYWARPENFASAPARAAREVKQPKERKKRETEKTPNPPQPIEPTKTIRPVEFVTVPCGVCRHCQCYGPVDIVAEADRAPKKPAARAREGPIPEIFAPGKPWQAPWKQKQA
jgi:hypothetical protein